jgi:outer membrane protein insertion porin family
MYKSAISYKRNTRRYSFMGLLCMFLSLSGCVSTTFLADNEYLLTKQKIKGNKSNSSEELELQFQQKGNRKILGSMPYLYAYFAGEKIYKKENVLKKIEKTKEIYAAKIKKDTLRPRKVARLEARRERKLRRLQTIYDEGNWLMRVVGEPPVILDSAQTEKTAEELRTYLFNQGFFEADVKYKITSRFRKSKITYYLTENAPHLVYQVNYITDDSRIKHLLDSSVKSAAIKPNQRYTQSGLIDERNRIDELLRSSGYFSFSRKFVNVEADTSVHDAQLGSRLVTLNFFIQNPPNGRHKPYRVTDIKVNIDNDRMGVVDTVWRYRGVLYKTNKRNFSDKVLDTKLLQHPSEWYDYSKMQNSQAQLASMDIFKFVNFNFDSTGGKLNLNVYTSRLPRYQITDELGLIVSQGAPGPFANVSFKVRNMFRNFGIFEIGGRYSQEGQLSTVLKTEDIYIATEWSANASLSFPNIVLPKVSRYLKSYSPRTRFLLGFTSVKRPEYNRDLSKATLTYTIQRDAQTQIGVSPIDISINNTTSIKDAFADWLDTLEKQGTNLKQSFNSALVTSFSAYYMYNSNQTGVRKRSKYFRLNVEWGGELSHLVSKLTNSPETDKVLGIRYFKFARASADFRFYQPFSKKSMLATRLNAGIVTPTNGSNTVPWEKFFFSGGSNSVRAWAPRRLGQGSSKNPSYQFERPGNIILEANVELRQKLFSFVETAIFADAGNVWNLTETSSDQGAQFRASRFWEQIAIGTGIGLRMDFSFLIVRFDAGTKTYDPARELNQRWVLSKWREKNQTLLNVGIGYPF